MTIPLLQQCTKRAIMVPISQIQDQHGFFIFSYPTTWIQNNNNLISTKRLILIVIFINTIWFQQNVWFWWPFFICIYEMKVLHSFMNIPSFLSFFSGKVKGFLVEANLPLATKLQIFSGTAKIYSINRWKAFL